MPSVDLTITVYRPTDTTGSTRVSVVVTGQMDVGTTDILVTQYNPPDRQGAQPRYIWQHVAYTDELVSVSNQTPTNGKIANVRKSQFDGTYTSIETANRFVASVKSQVKRLMDDIRAGTLNGVQTTTTINADAVVLGTESVTIDSEVI